MEADGFDVGAWVASVVGNDAKAVAALAGKSREDILKVCHRSPSAKL